VTYRDPYTLQVGTTVLLYGLNKDNYNGQYGAIVKSLANGADRYQVQLVESKKMLMVRPRNLKVARVKRETDPSDYTEVMDDEEDLFEIFTCTYCFVKSKSARELGIHYRNCITRQRLREFDSDYDSDYESKPDEVANWLIRLGLERYLRLFIHWDYCSMEKIKGLDAEKFEQMLHRVGASKDAKIIFKKSLKGTFTVEDWLASLDLRKYAKVFAEEEYDDMGSILNMNSMQLKHMLALVPNLEHRRKIRNNLDHYYQHGWH